MCRALDEDGSRGTAELGLPAGVQTLIARRLDRLGGPARQLLAVAAVIGRAFEFPLVARAAGLAEVAAAEALEELVRRRVLQDTGEGFDFTHDRIRQVAASMLLPARQAVLHRQTGEAIEAMHDSDLDPHASTLGRHFRAAGVWGKAVTYLRRAGVLALARWAYREAAACFEEALDALAHLPQTRETLEQAIDLRLDLRRALGPLARRGDLLERMREAETLAIRIGDRRRLRPGPRDRACDGEIDRQPRGGRLDRRAGARARSRAAGRGPGAPGRVQPGRRLLVCRRVPACRGAVRADAPGPRG